MKSKATVESIAESTNGWDIAFGIVDFEPMSFMMAQVDLGWCTAILNYTLLSYLIILLHNFVVLFALVEKLAKLYSCSLRVTFFCVCLGVWCVFIFTDPLLRIE